MNLGRARVRWRAGRWSVLITCALAAPVGSAAVSAWQPLSPPDLPAATPVPSALAGGKVVVAWISETSAALATTFTSTPQTSVIGAATAPIASAVPANALALVARRAAGASAVYGSWRNQDRGDPRNGLAVVSRSPGGSWGAPRIVATGATSICGVAALLLPDGSPLYATNAADCEGLGIFHGSAYVGDADTMQYAPDNEVMNPALARDGRGNVWVAWYTSYQGVVMRQLGAATGTPIGIEAVAPDSIPPESIWETPGVSRFTLVCNPAAAGCRVVYKAHLGSRIVSWAPRGGPPRVLASAGAGIALGAVTAAYRGDGRLWVAWIANPNFDRPSLRFSLTGPTGRLTRIRRGPTPEAGAPTRLSLQPIAGGLLVLAGVPTPSTQTGDVPIRLFADNVTNR